MTPMPLLTAWEEVGRTIFVAETIRDVVAATAPAARATRSVVIPERVDLPELQRTKRPEAARTIGLVGWNKVSKDPQWAFDVVEKLRETDPTWRLLLVGETAPAPPQRTRSGQSRTTGNAPEATPCTRESC